jgi:hypothetical protein
MSESSGKVHKKNEGNHGKVVVTQTVAMTASDKKRKTRHL